MSSNARAGKTERVQDSADCGYGRIGG